MARARECIPVAKKDFFVPKYAEFCLEISVVDIFATKFGMVIKFQFSRIFLEQIQIHVVAIFENLIDHLQTVFFVVFFRFK